MWSYDFTLDETADGRRLKRMPVVDKFTRECHAVEVERSLTAQDVVATLRYLFRVHGEPEYIRSDNRGPLSRRRSTGRSSSPRRSRSGWPRVG